MSYQFLTIDEVIEINRNQTELYGGDFSLDHPDLLDSAVNAPQATYGGSYLNEFPFEMAAAYLLSICQNHAFRDGNKRTAYVAALVFLDWHGWTIAADDQMQENLVLDVAEGRLDKSNITSFLRSHAIPLSDE